MRLQRPVGFEQKLYPSWPPLTKGRNSSKAVNSQPPRSLPSEADGRLLPICSSGLPVVGQSSILCSLLRSTTILFLD